MFMTKQARQNICRYQASHPFPPPFSPVYFNAGQAPANSAFWGSVWFDAALNILSVLTCTFLLATEISRMLESYSIKFLEKFQIRTKRHKDKTADPCLLAALVLVFRLSRWRGVALLMSLQGISPPSEYRCLQKQSRLFLRLVQRSKCISNFQNIMGYQKAAQSITKCVLRVLHLFAQCQSLQGSTLETSVPKFNLTLSVHSGVCLGNTYISGETSTGSFECFHPCSKAILKMFVEIWNNIFLILQNDSVSNELIGHKRSTLYQCQDKYYSNLALEVVNSPQPFSLRYLTTLHLCVLWIAI